jgi:hypothetical protein
METSFHHLSDLFSQLGLPSDPAEVARFIREQGPLPAGVALADAPLWSRSQAAFLREQLADDADWAEVVDALNALLSA